MKNYEAELPQNYKLVKTIDAKNIKVGIVLNIVALLVLAACIVAAYFLIGVPLGEMFDFSVNYGVGNLIRLLILLAVFVAYIILHELVHGAAYKALTKQKLTFGLTLTVAFCGVPHIYVYRKTALISVLAPFVVFTPIFLALCFVLPAALDKLLAAFMLGMHVGGCCGDLWVAGLLTFKYRDKTTLMNDTGPKQTFYVISDEPIESLPVEEVATDEQTEENIEHHIEE